MITQEKQRASEEERGHWAYLENYDPITENERLENDMGYQLETSAYSSAQKKFDNNLTTMMLKHLLYLQGYRFDEKEYLDDLILNELQEISRDTGEERDLEQIDALNRLNSLNAYLKKV